MFTKMVLPRLGGAPTVWSVAMVFFQAALLAGYAYAHLLDALPAARASARSSISACWPLAAMTLADRHRASASVRRRPAALRSGSSACSRLSIGLPFAVLSASAPLLQGWFAASGHPQAGNPYVLYAASNLGSFAALLAYPVVIEPLLSLEPSGAAVVASALPFSRDPDRGDRALHRAPAEPHPGRRSGGTGVDARPPCLDCAVRDPGRPRHRGDVLHHDRCCGGAVSLGGCRSRSIS